MSPAKATPEDTDGEYEFDLAVSFAGENRTFVEEIVRKLGGDEFKIFYDADYSVELWGEDNVEYLTKVYSKRARYVAMFISHHYAAKPWTNHERKSALSRALSERSAYILPIRLDDTELPGLLPTIGYLEANREGVDGIVAAIQKKLGATATAPEPSPYHGGVARTPEELQELIAQRTPGWEYVLYASVLEQGRNALADDRRDHEIRYAAPNGKKITSVEEAHAAYSDALHDLDQTANSFNKVLEEKAFRAAMGKPGEPGDPDRILHLGRRFIDVYRRFLQIAADLNGASVAEDYRPVIELAASTLDKPLEDLDKFIDYFVPLINEMPERLKNGENVELSLIVELSLDTEALDAVTEELKRLYADEEG